jgi:hypothetical protein
MFYINNWMNIRSFGGSSKYCGQIYIIIVEVSIYCGGSSEEIVYCPYLFQLKN